ncbi:hypothetical protein N0V88_006302 [Collariella sp. IMI 366227]|nr:hypothetical protein N0V88_006302 [Collariella sp. IMI 366227]
MNFIYHQLEGTRPGSGQQKEVEEMGPGLDRFNLRRLYFGDLADSAESWRVPNDTAAMLVDRDLASRLLERYLATFWHLMPIWSKDEYRGQLARLYVPAEMFSSENPDTMIVLLAMALGGSMLEEEAVAQFLFQKVKRWSARHDEMVNVQAKAILKWLCFSLGRPSSFPESEMRVPLPAEQKLLQSLVALARLMSKCATLIYKQRHKSLAPVWNAANEIRRELLQFAEQQRKDLNFGLIGDPSTGELGEIKYHTFFVEGASHVLALDLLQDKVAGRANLPWIQTAIRTLRMLRPRSDMSPLHAVDLANNLERMACFVYPDFRATAGDPHLGVNPAAADAADGLRADPLQPAANPSSSMLFGLGASASTISTPTGFSSEGVEQHGDMLSADGGWDFDFATADMEAFLSIDPNLASYQLPTYPSC